MLGQTIFFWPKPVFFDFPYNLLLKICNNSLWEEWVFQKNTYNAHKEFVLQALQFFEMVAFISHLYSIIPGSYHGERKILWGLYAMV